jgi:hypothetical protein
MEPSPAGTLSCPAAPSGFPLRQIEEVWFNGIDLLVELCTPLEFILAIACSKRMAWLLGAPNRKLLLDEGLFIASELLCISTPLYNI